MPPDSKQSASADTIMLPPPMPVTVRGSQVACRALKWLWPQRVPLGKITLLAGDAEQGKSLLAIDMAARVSRGGAWPEQAAGEAPSGSVVFLSAEDQTDDVLVPRLQAAGADLARCVILERAHGPIGLPRRLSLDADLCVLRRTLLDHPDCRLVVIDPIGAYLGRIDGNHPGKLRALLAALAELAAERETAFLLVSRLAQSTTTHAVQRTLATMALVSLSRIAWLVSPDPDHEGRRLVVPVENNFCALPGGLAFRVTAQNTGAAPRIEWDTDPVDPSLIEAAGGHRGCSLAEQKYRDQENWAVTWLREQLQDGPQKRSDVWYNSRRDDISKDQLYRAAKRLGVVKRKSGMSWDDTRWMLPEHANTQEAKQ